jgi:beta-glucosidase
VVWVNGIRKGTATLDRAGEAAVSLATSTKTALVVVTYTGDRTFLPWVASPHLLTVR